MMKVLDEPEWWIVTYALTGLIVLCGLIGVVVWRDTVESERIGIVCVQAGGSWDGKAEKCERNTRSP